jgi:hypothetical protein
VHRHDALRTRIVVADGIPWQCIDPVRGDHLRIIDLTGVSSMNVEQEMKGLAQEFVDERTDLTVGPLFRGKLWKISALEHVLILTVDHIIADAASCAIIRRELWTLYHQLGKGRQSSLPQLPVQFADHAVWLQEVYSAWQRRYERYWKGRLIGSPHTKVPIDDGMADVQPHTVATLHFPFGKALTAKLRDMARYERTLLQIVVLAVYVATMSRWCNERDLVIRFVSHGRYGRPELENMVGLLTSVLHLRIEIAREDCFVDLLKRVSSEFASAHEHEDFNRVPELIPECATELSFNWLPTKWTRLDVDSEGKSKDALRIHPFPVRVGLPEEPKLLSLFSETAAGINMTVMYRPDLFSASTIRRFGHNLRSFAAEAVERPMGRTVLAS